MKPASYLRISLMGMLFSFACTSCKKDNTATTVTIVDPTVVGAATDSTTDFTSYKTIAISDSVSVINGYTVTKELTTTESAFMQTLIDSLSARGYQIVSSASGGQDLQLNITRVASTSDGLMDSTSYWANYGAFYAPALYNESNLSYGTRLNTSFSVGDGLLSFELLDLKNAIANGRIGILWEGVVMGTANINDDTKVSAEASAMLADSPKLKAN
ncbi:MAG TPA: hypothetical protein VG842_09385 [Sediminibacterium sp.]|nr:hypothetical protein [Sediminibacterium sp.]